MPTQRTTLAQVEPPTLEELLHRIENRAGFLRDAADSAAQNPQPPDAQVLSGWADTCAELQEELAHQARRRSEAVE